MRYLCVEKPVEKPVENSDCIVLRSEGEALAAILESLLGIERKLGTLNRSVAAFARVVEDNI